MNLRKKYSYTSTKKNYKCEFSNQFHPSPMSCSSTFNQVYSDKIWCIPVVWIFTLLVGIYLITIVTKYFFFGKFFWRLFEGNGHIFIISRGKLKKNHSCFFLIKLHNKWCSDRFAKLEKREERRSGSFWHERNTLKQILLWFGYLNFFFEESWSKHRFIL